jgi:hypothetical protein
MIICLTRFIIWPLLPTAAMSKINYCGIKASLRPPATVWVASSASTNSACGINRSNASAAARVTMRPRPPRPNLVAIIKLECPNGMPMHIRSRYASVVLGSVRKVLCASKHRQLFIDRTRA